MNRQVPKILFVAAAIEVATGIALLTVPSVVGRVLLGEELMGVGISVARVTGIALTAFGIACWPGPPLVGMLTYSAGVTLYLALLGFTSSMTGVLLWPAVILHALMTGLLARTFTRNRDMTV